MDRIAGRLAVGERNAETTHHSQRGSPPNREPFNGRHHIGDRGEAKYLYRARKQGLVDDLHRVFNPIHSTRQDQTLHLSDN